MEKKNRILHISVDIILIALLVWFDQFTKSLAVDKLKNNQAFIIINNVFELNYLENRGAAFGMLQNKQSMFAVTGTVMLIIVLYVLLRMPFKKRYYLFEICCILIAAGAIGNMIDRVSQGYVVDFFYFVLINFPIFNVADIYVTISCITLAILILFVYSDDELAFLSFKKKDTNEIDDTHMKKESSNEEL